MSKSQSSTLRRNIAANVMMSGIMSLYPLVCVPVFISNWGVKTYGEWLILVSIAGYFQLADLGLNTSTANAVVIAAVNGHLHRVRRLVLNNIIFITAAFVLLTVLVILALHTSGFSRFINGAGNLEGALNGCLLLIIIQTYIGMLTNLLGGLYRANDNYAAGLMIDNAIRVSEYVAALLLVSFGGFALVVLQGVVVVKCAGLIVKAVNIQARMKMETSYSSTDISFQEVRCALGPSLAFVLFPVSGMIANSTPLLVINTYLGAPLVVLYGTMRTFMNTSRVFVDIVQRSVWPEITWLYAQEKKTLVLRAYNKTLLFAVLISATIAAVLATCGDRLYNIWTGNTTQWNSALGVALALAAVSSCVSATGTMVLQAMNHPEKVSYVVLIVTLTSILLLLAISRALPISCIPYAQVASEIIVAVVAHRLIRTALVDGKKTSE